MKDKELRKLLESNGIIETESSGCLLPMGYGIGDYTINHIKRCIENQEAKIKGLEESKGAGEVSVLALGNSINDLSDDLLHTQYNVIVGLSNQIKEMEAKFDAINKHYGVTVEHEDAKYTVKEIK